MKFRILLRPAAEEDLVGIYQFIARDSSARAPAYIDRIQRHYEELAEMPDRGAPRENLGTGIRLLSFERRVVILYRVEGQNVRILRTLYGDRDYDDQSVGD